MTRDPNKAFALLHDKYRKGELSKDAYTQQINRFCVSFGKLPVPKREVEGNPGPERSGNLIYTRRNDGTIDVTLADKRAKPTDLQSYPRYIRQAARVDLDLNMTDDDAAKLNAALLIDEATHRAVLEDLLVQRANAMMQHHGAVPQRAAKLDESLHLADNPDRLELDQLVALLGSKPDVDRNR